MHLSPLVVLVLVPLVLLVTLLVLDPREVVTATTTTTRRKKPGFWLSDQAPGDGSLIRLLASVNWLCGCGL